ncbi:gas vesicle accessory protein GvpU [Pseudomonas sp. VEM90]
MENAVNLAAEAAKVNDKVDRDWLLQHLVTHANLAKDFHQPITLWMAGGMISGVLVSGKEYFDAYTEQFVSRFTPEAAEGTRKTLRSIGSRYYEEDESPDANNTIFIHLINAQFWTPSGSIPSSKGAGMVWRGRLSQVTGFSLGQLEKAE